MRPIKAIYFKHILLISYRNTRCFVICMVAILWSLTGRAQSGENKMSYGCGDTTLTLITGQKDYYFALSDKLSHCLDLDTLRPIEIFRDLRFHFVNTSDDTLHLLNYKYSGGPVYWRGNPYETVLPRAAHIVEPFFSGRLPHGPFHRVLVINYLRKGVPESTLLLTQGFDQFREPYQGTRQPVKYPVSIDSLEKNYPKGVTSRVPDRDTLKVYLHYPHAYKNTRFSIEYWDKNDTLSSLPVRLNDSLSVFQLSILRSFNHLFYLHVLAENYGVVLKKGIRKNNQTSIHLEINYLPGESAPFYFDGSVKMPFPGKGLYHIRTDSYNPGIHDSMVKVLDKHGISFIDKSSSVIQLSKTDAAMEFRRKLEMEAPWIIMEPLIDMEFNGFYDKWDGYHYLQNTIIIRFEAHTPIERVHEILRLAGLQDKDYSCKPSESYKGIACIQCAWQPLLSFVSGNYAHLNTIWQFKEVLEIQQQVVTEAGLD